jgi:putative peptidoglycan lipid II flippase
MTAMALICYSFGMVAFGLRDIISRVFYSLQDTKTPMINGAITIILNIILSLTLVKYMDHAGIALATSISSLFCVVLLFFSLRKKIGPFGEKKIIIIAIKSISASIVMGIITKLSYGFIDNILGIGFINEFITLAVSIIAGAVVYTISMLILKVDEIDIVLDKLRNLIKRISQSNK